MIRKRERNNQVQTMTHWETKSFVFIIILFIALCTLPTDIESSILQWNDLKLKQQVNGNGAFVMFFSSPIK